MCIRLIIIILLAIGASFLESFPDDLLLSTFFTVASIFFSIGLSIIVTFDFDKIENAIAYEDIKNNINKIRNSFLRFFASIVFAYLFGSYLMQSESQINIVKNLIMYTMPSLMDYSIKICQFITNLMFSTILISICYFIINFIEMQKLKDAINTQSMMLKRNSHI